MPRVELALKTANAGGISLVETKPPQNSDAPRAGADLREARERLGWALPDVAAMLRIRASYLEALESGRLTYLPGNVYAIGFLRTYATALGLDVEDICRRFRAEAGEIPRHSELIFPEPLPERGLPAGALILIGLVLAAGAYIGWYRLSGEAKLPAESVPPVPARLEALVQSPLPVPVVTPVPLPQTALPVAAPAQPVPQPSPPEDIGLFEPRQAAADLPRPQLPRAPAPIEDMASISSGAPTAAIAMPVPQPLRPAKPANQASVVPAPDSTRIVLRFTGDTWVHVKERGGETLLSKVMHAGDSWPVPSHDNLLLSTGNAGRIDILVDGTEVPAIGGPGSLRTDVALDPELLKSGPIMPVSGRR